MATRVQTESAQRTSDCVTELLRKQPFFGSLALRLPLRADPSRETLASDGHEIRYSPKWVADTDAHVIETAMARVVMACALKHHTRRGERDPERWQLASQLVTHALLRDSGFTLPPDAEAWDGVSVEQAYDRLPEPQEDDSGGDSGSPSVGGDMGAGAAAASGGGDEGASDSPSDSSGEATARRRTARARAATPMRRRATILPAPERSWTRAPAATAMPGTASLRSTSPPRSRRGTRPCTRP